MKENKEELEIKPKKKRHIIIRIFDIIVWLVIFVWMCMCVTDYFNVVNERDPRFCVENDILEYEDGNIYVCKGIGYVIYRSDRESISGYQFGSFWSENKFDK